MSSIKGSVGLGPTQREVAHVIILSCTCLTTPKAFNLTTIIILKYLIAFCLGLVRSPFLSLLCHIYQLGTCSMATLLKHLSTQLFAMKKIFKFKMIGRNPDNVQIICMCLITVLRDFCDKAFC